MIHEVVAVILSSSQTDPPQQSQKSQKSQESQHQQQVPAAPRFGGSFTLDLRHHDIQNVSVSLHTVRERRRADAFRSPR